MNKGYNIKVYDLEGNLITTITKPLSRFSFSNSINSGVDNINIDTKEPTNSTLYDNASFVEITEYSDIDKTGTPLFAGYVQSLPGKITENQDTIGLECVGFPYMFSTILYESGGILTFNKTDTLTNVLTEIVTLFNSKQQRNPPASYNGFVGSDILKLDTMPALNIDLDFDKDTVLSAIIKCFEGAGLDFYVTPAGLIKAKQKPATAQHKLTMKKDVQNLDIKRADKADLVNYLRLERNGGVVVVYQDATSQTTYGFREAYVSKTDIGDVTTQNQYGDKYISDNKDPKREVTIVVNTRYDIASIEPGDYVKVLNSDLGIDNLKIIKTAYNGDTITLNVDKYISLGQLLK